MFRTKNDLSEGIRVKAVELLNARLADCKGALNKVSRSAKPAFQNRGPVVAKHRGKSLPAKEKRRFFQRKMGTLSRLDHRERATTFNLVDASWPAVRALHPSQGVEGIAMARAKLILVVEDDADTRESMRRLLEASGFAVICAANGENAMACIAQRERPHVILMDLAMPVMDGWDFRSQLGRDVALASIPVIIISAQNDLPQIAASLEATAYFRKPVEVDGLLHTIRVVA
jgi:CheY-like chemotaxis protein